MKSIKVSTSQASKRGSKKAKVETRLSIATQPKEGPFPEATIEAVIGKHFFDVCLAITGHGPLLSEQRAAYLSTF